MIFTQQLGGLGRIAQPVVAAGGVSWNPANVGSGVILSGGNLTATAAAPADYANVRSTVSKSAGKWYFEVLLTTVSNGFTPVVGISTRLPSLSDGAVGSSSGDFGLFANGAIFVGGTYMDSWTTGLSSGNVVMVAFDLDDGKIWWGKNGTWLNSGDPASGTGAAATGVTGAQLAALSVGPSGSESLSTVRFASSDFSYSPPAGFSELA